MEIHTRERARPTRGMGFHTRERAGPIRGMEIRMGGRTRKAETVVTRAMCSRDTREAAEAARTGVRRKNAAAPEMC